jgi:glycosyltransferase involved in cell wall biosynthesis
VASVVIPAHDEAAVIGRCLRMLLAGAPPGSLQVAVVPNGCTDATARIARAVPGVTVVELAAAGKAAALTAGDAAVTAFPRFYLDADVELTYPALAAVVREMATTGAPAAAPRQVWDRTGASRWVRAYHSVWEELPYGRDSLVGGVYALSAEGRRRFGAFPDVIADDLFVRGLFHPRERPRLDSATFVVHPPRTLRELIRVQTRQRVGNAELRARVASTQPAGPQSAARSAGRRLALLAARPRLWPAIPVHAAVYVLVRCRSRAASSRGDHRWLRDDSSRIP